MANVEKYHHQEIPMLLGHIGRAFEHSSNPEIDISRRSENYSLAPDRGNLTPYEYYQKRLGEVYIYDPARLHRDLNTCFSWVITLPKEITSPTDETRFFETVSEFMLNRYGRANCCALEVHRDESTPHMHAVFIAATKNNMQSHEHPQTDKLACKEIINRAELRSFHSALQQFLDTHQVKGQVLTGVTAGTNRSIKELKRDSLSDLRAENNRLREVEAKYNELLQTRNIEHERSRWDRQPDIEPASERRRFW